MNSAFIRWLSCKWLAVSATSLLLLGMCVSGPLLAAQEAEPRDIEERANTQTREGRYEFNRKVYGEARAEQLEDEDRKRLNYYALHPEEGPHGYDAYQYQQSRVAELGRVFEQRISTRLFTSEVSAGWSIAGHVWEYGIRDSPVRARSPHPGRGFFLTGSLESLQGPERWEDTIAVDPSDPQLKKFKNLTRFMEVNNALRDNVQLRSETDDDPDADLPGSMASVRRLLGLPREGHIPTFKMGKMVNTEPSRPELAKSDIIAVTGARLANGVEIVTLFDLRDSAATAALHGQMVILSSKGVGVDQVSNALGHMVASPPRGPRRVYYYGDELENVSIRALVEKAGHEYIRRSERSSADLLNTDKKLRALETAFVEDRLTVINGLPENLEAVSAMGGLNGDASDWLDFRGKVVDILQGHASQVASSAQKLRDELTEGENDVIVLVAHATGAYLYINGERLSINDISRTWPRRRLPLTKPRVAVLISCETGKPARPLTGWRSWFSKQMVPLAEILVEKGYVSKVVAPDHTIRQDEALTVLQHALKGVPPRSLFKDWINWAMVKYRLQELIG